MVFRFDGVLRFGKVLRFWQVIFCTARYLGFVGYFTLARSLVMVGSLDMAGS